MEEARTNLHKHEPTFLGRFVVWRVLGLGRGGTRIHVYSCGSHLSMAMRPVQCLVNCTVGTAGRFRSQLYVDDPALCISGSSATVARALYIALLWWLSLGLSLAWDKGTVFPVTEEHMLIGALFKLLASGGGVTMELPP